MSNMLSKEDKVVAIVGMGYVGIPLCKSFLDSGLKVIGIDINNERINQLIQNNIVLNHLANIDFKKYLDNKDVTFSSDIKDCENADSIIICVPTPLNDEMKPDLDPIKNAISSIIPHLKKGQTISLESTTYPGTTRDEIVEPIEKTGLKVGKDIFVVYSPEREDPGNKKFNCKNTPKVIGGITQDCLENGLDLYSNVVDTLVPVSSCEVAEFSKLYENIYRAVNIGLANEMKIIADSFDLDIFEIIKAADTKPFGFSAFYPGPGVGGHCIPVDPEYLNWKARSLNTESKLIETALSVNRNITDFVIQKTISELKKVNKNIEKSNILILGVSYKSNIDDIRESPSLDVIEKLLNLNANISYDDKYISKILLGDLKDNINQVFDATLSEKVLSKFDAILILTNHDYYNIENIAKYSKLVIDTRGVFELDKTNIFRG